MPNRIIKESICTSENLNSLSRDAEVFFYRLIVNCDDYGLMDGRTSILRAKCFPLKVDTVKEKDINKWLQELVDADLIFLYYADGKQYLKMSKWENHQQIRSKKSKFPMPDTTYQHMKSDDIRCPRNPIRIQSESNPNPNTNMCVDTPAEKSSFEDEGAQEDNSGKGEEYTADFERFWIAYPRRVEKRKAFKAWNTRAKEKASPEDIITAAINYAMHCRNQRTDERYIKHPSTFLGPDKPYEEYINYIPTEQAAGVPSNVAKALELVKKAQEEEANGVEGGSLFD